MIFTVYCKKCGIVTHSSHTINNKCPFCETDVLVVPNNITRSFFFDPVTGFSKMNDYIRENIVKSNPEYDEELYTAREELESQIGSKIWEKGGAYWKEGCQPPTPLNIPKCPICGSTNIEKISLGNKVGSVALIGVFAVGHITKTYKCKNCNAKF